MYLQKIKLNYFRNYIEEEIEFNHNKIIILGENAQGKSNLLEAIQILSTLKSYRISKEQDLVYQNRYNAEINANIAKKYSNYNLKIRIPAKGRKEIKVNGEKQTRQLDFLGIVNTVLFSSLDIDLIRGNPEYRRNWVDNLLIQLEPVYAYIRSQYQHILKQRNALLKQLKKQGYSNHDSLSDFMKLQLKLWNDKLIETACRVMRRRQRVIQKLEPLARYWHEQISDHQEKLNIIYCPNIPYQEDNVEKIKQKIAQQIEQKASHEIIVGNTLCGPHRDDIQFMINDITVKNYGSQGQQRTLVLALKLAELQLIEEIIGESPILLLDDVMAELDLKRQQHLLDSLGNRFQTIITTTHLNYFGDRLLSESQILEVKKGQFVS